MKIHHPRVEKVIKLQMRAALFNGVLSVILTILIILSSGVTGFFMVALLSYLIAYIICKVLNFVSAILIQIKVYGSDVEGMKREMMSLTRKEPDTAVEKKDEPQQVSVKVVAVPSSILGKYQDTAFYEWIDVDDGTGSIKRLYFDGTVDMKKNFTIQPGTVTFPPGLIYRWKRQDDAQ